MPSGKYLRNPLPIETFIAPLPTERLIWLAKVVLDELAKRELAKRPVKSKPQPQVFQQHGRTLR